MIQYIIKMILKTIHINIYRQQRYSALDENQTDVRL
jgi:hypothetical protein